MSLVENCECVGAVGMEEEEEETGAKIEVEVDDKIGGSIFVQSQG